MKYITVLAPNGKSAYLAKARIGGGYTTLATFLNEETAKKTAAILNRHKSVEDEITQMGNDVLEPVKIRDTVR